MFGHASTFSYFRNAVELLHLSLQIILRVFLECAFLATQNGECYYVAAPSQPKKKPCDRDHRITLRCAGRFKAWITRFNDGLTASSGPQPLYFPNVRSSHCQHTCFHRPVEAHNYARHEVRSRYIRSRFAW